MGSTLQTLLPPDPSLAIVQSPPAAERLPHCDLWDNVAVGHLFLHPLAASPEWLERKALLKSSHLDTLLL